MHASRNNNNELERRTAEIEKKGGVVMTARGRIHITLLDKSGIQINVNLYS